MQSYAMICVAKQRSEISTSDNYSHWNMKKREITDFQFSHLLLVLFFCLSMHAHFSPSTIEVKMREIVLKQRTKCEHPKRKFPRHIFAVLALFWCDVHWLHRAQFRTWNVQFRPRESQNDMFCYSLSCYQNHLKGNFTSTAFAAVYSQRRKKRRKKWRQKRRRRK